MRSFLILMASFVCQGAFASLDLNFHHFPLDYPTYINYSKFDLKLGQESVLDEGFPSSLIKISYFDSAGKTYEDTIRLSFEKVLTCIRNKECLIRNISSSSHLFTRSCRLDVSIITAERILAKTQVQWGVCKGFVSNLKKDVGLERSDALVVKKNSGVPGGVGPFRTLKITGLEGNFELSAIGLDYRSDPIWSSKRFVKESIVEFESTISPYIYSRLCEIILIADYHGKIEDEKLENNVKHLKEGKCFQTAQDQLPDLNVLADVQKLYVFNLNDAIFPADSISVSFQLFDDHGNQRMDFVREVPGNLRYREYSEYDFSTLLTEEYCRLTAKVNFNRSVSELDYSNNEIIIDKCN